MNADAASHELRVEVPASPLRQYDVIVRAGALRELGTRVAALANAARYAVIVPDDVAATHGDVALAALRDAGLDAVLLEFAAGEAHKTRATWAALTDHMLEHRLGRDCCVVAVGGGVAGDLAGFVAATYMRGVPVVQVPTTLLAMIDASVGGKTGVDTAAGKNLVGAFHPPCLVIADPLALRTLPARELRAGMAEAVKHAVMFDREYFDWIDAHAAELLALEPDAVTELVVRSVRIKGDVVMRDPYEAGLRATLNFGHTVGHALELHAGYALAHGHAVAIGMVVEADLGEAAGVTERGTAARIQALLERLTLPVASGVADAGMLLEHMRLDKKARRALPRFALPARLGEAASGSGGNWTLELPETVVESVLRRVFDGRAAV